MASLTPHEKTKPLSSKILIIILILIALILVGEGVYYFYLRDFKNSSKVDIHNQVPKIISPSPSSLEKEIDFIYPIWREDNIISLKVEGIISEVPRVCEGGSLCVDVLVEDGEDNLLTFSLGLQNRILVYNIGDDPQVKSEILTNLIPEFRKKRKVGLVIDLESLTDFSNCQAVDWCVALSREYEEGLKINKEFWENISQSADSKWPKTIGPVTRVVFY